VSAAEFERFVFGQPLPDAAAPTGDDAHAAATRMQAIHLSKWRVT